MTGRSSRRWTSDGAAPWSGLFALSLALLAACAAFTKGDTPDPSGGGSEAGLSPDGAPLNPNTGGDAGANEDAGEEGGFPATPSFCSTSSGDHWICEDFDSPDGGIQAAIDKTPSSGTSIATLVARADAPSRPRVLNLEARAQSATASVFKSVSQPVVGATCSFAIRVLERPSVLTTVYEIQFAAGTNSWHFMLQLRPAGLCNTQIVYEDVMGGSARSGTNCTLKDNEWTNVSFDVNPKLPRVLAKVGASVVHNDTTPPFLMNVSEQVTIQIGPASISAPTAHIEIDNVVCERIVP